MLKMLTKKTSLHEKEPAGFHNENLKAATVLRSSGRRKHRSPETIYKSAKMLIAVLVVATILIYAFYTIILDFNKP